MTRTIDALVEALTGEQLADFVPQTSTVITGDDGKERGVLMTPTELRQFLAAALAQARAEQAEPVAEGNQAARLSDHASVPRELLAAACSAIDKKRDAPKTLAQLRRYTTGDLSGYATPTAAPVARAEQAEPHEITEEMLQAGANAPYTSTEGIGIEQMFGTMENPCDWRGALRLIYTAMREAAHNAKLGNK